MLRKVCLKSSRKSPTSKNSRHVTTVCNDSPVQSDLPVGCGAKVEPGDFSLVQSLIGSTNDDGSSIGILGISKMKFEKENSF